VLVSTVEVLAAPALAAFLDLREQVSKNKYIKRGKNEEKNRKAFSERRSLPSSTSASKYAKKICIKREKNEEKIETN
jgi:hypothetical protein